MRIRPPQLCAGNCGRWIRFFRKWTISPSLRRRAKPCGLGQLIAMKYGSVPIVRHTDGLVDTVRDLTSDLSKGSGFVFNDYNSEAMLEAIARALESYQNKAWSEVTQRIMASQKVRGCL
jgi:glycogen synthase